MPFGVNKLTGKPGPCPKPPVDGNKKQARHRVNMEVKSGSRPNPNTLPCFDCGHLGPGQRHEYDHFLGYAAENHLAVQAVCVKCHHKRDNFRAKKKYCLRGHKYIKANTILKANGTRQCRQCRREKDRKRRDKMFWRNYRQQRKEG